MNEVLAQQYSADLEARQANLGQNHLSQMMRDSLTQLKSHGLPGKKLEHWKYTSINSEMPEQLAAPQADQASPTFEIKDAHQILIVNGFLTTMPEIPGVHIRKMNPHESHDSIPMIQEERDGAGWLHWSTLQEVLAIQIEKNVMLENPIVIHHLFTKKASKCLSSHRVVIHAADLCDLFILEVTTGLDAHELSTFNATELHLSTGARIRHIQLTSELKEGVHYSALKAELARDSYLNSFALTAHAKLHRRDIKVNLNDENATAHVNGLFTLKDHEHCDTDSIINHNAAHTFSEQLYKGVVADHSHGIFTGKIVVHRDAQKVDSQQLSRNLILTKSAHIDARPQLEVYADDVKCSHGATIGQLSVDELFYLESRGIERSEAARILAHAFVQEAIDKVGHSTLVPLLSDWLSNHYEITTTEVANE